jgi:hypothetical protein
MGFERPNYRLIFNGNYEGLEVSTKGGNIGEMVRFGALLSMGNDLMDPKNETERKELIDMLGKKLISWNLEDEQGEPVPATADQLAEEDVFLLIAIVRGWMNRGIGVSGPLVQHSSDGVPSEVESIPMEILP